ncbi:MAG: SAM-dependent DNA methyltransferase, partial [Candidatus Dadabacteria bacterium]
MDMEALKQRFLDRLRARGGSAGNQALREELGVADGTYTALVDLLVREGRIVRGRGRGGSVRLVEGPQG